MITSRRFSGKVAFVTGAGSGFLCSDEAALTVGHALVNDGGKPSDPTHDGRRTSTRSLRFSIDQRLRKDAT